MGCQPSKQKNEDIIQINSQTSSEFNIGPKQLICQDRGPIFDLYHFSTMISRSNYSIVRKAINRLSKQERVCKIIPLINKKYLTVVSEVQYLKKINHPNIVQIIEYFIEPSLIYIILEEIPGSKLLHELIGHSVSFITIKDIFLQLLSAVKYLHSKLISHRSITVDNILLYWVNETPFIKLIDFSQAAPMDCPNPSQVLISKRDIPLEYVDSKKLDKIDVYDCGMILWSMISGIKIKVSWLQNLDENLEKSLSFLKIQGVLKKDLKNLLQSMLHSNPRKRPTIFQCINHDLFKHFSNQSKIEMNSFQSMVFFPNIQAKNSQLFQFLRMYASLTMSSPLDKAELMIEFNNLDKNKDGEIQFSELTEGIVNTFNFDIKKAELHAKSIFEKLDKDNNGSLDFSEYVLGTINLTKLVTEEFLYKMFKELDHNNDGQIDEEELLDMIGDSVLISKKLIGKKNIDFNRFIKIMKQLVATSKQQIQKNPKQKKNKMVSINTIRIQQYESEDSNKENTSNNKSKFLSFFTPKKNDSAQKW